MIAKVQYQGKVYYSLVFAHFEVFYRNHYVVYDPIDNKFDIISTFGDNGYGHRQIGLIDERESGFIGLCDMPLKMGIAEDINGYPWLVREPEYLKNIEEGKEVPEGLIRRAKEMNATINPDKWNEVVNEDDVENMMNQTGGFHDQYWVEIKGVADEIDPFVDAKLQIRFTSQGPFDVLVEFEGGIHLDIGFYSSNRIFTSTIVIGKECIYWVNDAEDGLLEKDIKSYSYISSKKLRWKFIDKEENDW